MPGKSHGWRSVVGCSPCGREESDMTERLHFHFSLSCIGEGNGNPLQYSCLENPRDRGARWATVHWVTKSQTRLKRLSTHIMQGKGRSGWCGSTELQRGRNTAEPRSCPPHSAFACAGLCPLLSGEGDPITLSWVNICLPRFFALSSPLSLFSGLDLV